MAGEFHNLGPQITASTFIGTTFARDDQGRVLVCSVMRGAPAKLVVFDLGSGAILHILPLAGAIGGWCAATASDGSVYAGTDANGHLYRWMPGAAEVADLGKVPPNQDWVWDMTAGKDGEVFLATYNGCRIVRYHPTDGFSDFSNGPATAGEQYARSVAYDPRTEKIYAGVGAHAHLVEIDPRTGTKRELLPAQYANEEFVYGVKVYGDHLLALVTKLNKALVMNLRTGTIEAELPLVAGPLVTAKSPVCDEVYYVVDGHLHSYDLARPGGMPKKLVACPDPLAMTWQGNSTLIVFTKPAQVLRYDVTTGSATMSTFQTPTEPVIIQSMTTGPDGRIWIGGYLSGGNAAYDPEKNRSTEYKGLSQAESIAVLGQSVYFGLYPHGEFAAYDTTRPWDPAANNPMALGKIAGQSRPFAGLGVAELGKVFFGTVPEYGRLGGGIATYDPARGALDFAADIVKDQSVIALEYSHQLIVGGTSIWGGLGIKPTQREGKLFLWSPFTGQKVFETVPVENMMAVTCVVNGPDGKIWGLAEGTLFLFDVATRTIISRHKLFDIDYGGKQIWRDATLIVHPSGQVYGTLRGRFFRLDPLSKEMTLLREKGIGLLAIDAAGRLYFRESANLCRYQPETAA